MKNDIYYGAMFKEFIMRYPFLDDEITRWEPCGNYELVAYLKDGEVVIYDNLYKTIKSLNQDRDILDLDDSEFRKDFGYRLYRMIEIRGVTQKELSEATHISQHTISKYVNGEVTPSYFNVLKLARALDCSVAEFTYFE